MPPEPVKKRVYEEFRKPQHLYDFLAPKLEESPEHHPLKDMMKKTNLEDQQQAEELKKQLLEHAKKLFPRMWSEVQKSPEKSIEELEEAFLKRLYEAHILPTTLNKKTSSMFQISERWKQLRRQSGVDGQGGLLINPYNPAVQEAVENILQTRVADPENLPKKNCKKSS